MKDCSNDKEPASEREEALHLWVAKAPHQHLCFQRTNSTTSGSLFLVGLAPGHLHCLHCCNCCFQDCCTSGSMHQVHPPLSPVTYTSVLASPLQLHSCLSSSPRWWFHLASLRLLRLCCDWPRMLPAPTCPPSTHLVLVSPASNSQRLVHHVHRHCFWVIFQAQPEQRCKSRNGHCNPMHQLLGKRSAAAAC